MGDCASSSLDTRLKDQGGYIAAVAKLTANKASAAAKARLTGLRALRSEIEEREDLDAVERRNEELRRDWNDECKRIRRRVYQARYRAKHREKLLERHRREMREYRRRHPERSSSSSSATSAWRARNAERLRAVGRAWRAAHKDEIRASKRLWRLANPERAREHVRKHRAKKRALSLAEKRDDQ